MIQVEVDKRISIYIFFIRLLYSTLQWMSRSVVKQMNIEPSIVLQNKGWTVCCIGVRYVYVIPFPFSIGVANRLSPTSTSRKVTNGKTFQNLHRPCNPDDAKQAVFTLASPCCKMSKGRVGLFFPETLGRLMGRGWPGFGGGVKAAAATLPLNAT